MITLKDSIEVEATERHMREEGENLKKALEKEHGSGAHSEWLCVTFSRFGEVWIARAARRTESAALCRRAFW